MFILHISSKPRFGFSNHFFLLKTEIHMQILNTKPFLYNFGGLRNLQNKIGFLNKLLWSKLKWFHFDVLYILKTTWIKAVFTSIQLVCVTRPPGHHLGAIRTRLGSVGGALRKFWGFEAIMRQHKYEMTCFRTAFCFVKILAP